MKHSDYVKALESYGEGALKKLVIKWVVKKLPFFAIGPLNQLLVMAASKFAEEAIEEAEMRVFFKYTDLRTDDQAKDFEGAMLYNHTMQTIGTEDEKKIAEDRLDTELSKLWNLLK